MTPLQWPSFHNTSGDTNWFKRLFRHSMNQVRVWNFLKDQMLSRLQPEPHIWGDDPDRIKLAQLLCKRIKENYSWPNAHFIPEDPVDVALLIPWDDLDIVELVMQLEKDLDFEIDNSEAYDWAGKSLSSIVDTLQAKCNAKI